MIIATYNVNGINGRLPVLLRWLAEATRADIEAEIERLIALLDAIETETRLFAL